MIIYTIERLNTVKHILKKPIRVTVEMLNIDEYIARFEEAEISFSGYTAAEAVRELEIEILEVYKDYTSESNLGPWPKHQLAILENYLDKI